MRTCYHPDMDEIWVKTMSHFRTRPIRDEIFVSCRLHEIKVS